MIRTIYHYFNQQYTEYVGRIASINHYENTTKRMFLPMDIIYDTVVPGTIATFLVISFVYLFVYLLISDSLLQRFDNDNKKGTNNDINNTNHNHTNGDAISSTSKIQLRNQLQRRRKFAYQITNIITNGTLGIMGLYYECSMQRPINFLSIPIEEKISSYENYIIFSYIQLGYQLWALPVGIWFVNENTTMILHHVAVILVSCMSGFLQNGFRYWTPYCYGMIEFSSVPLGIMNIFKENPSLIHHYNKKYVQVRLVFASLFLVLRVILFVPCMCHVLFCEFIIIRTYTNSTTNNLLNYSTYMSFVWFSTFILVVLQIQWGSTIIHGLLKHFAPNLLVSKKKQDTPTTTGSKKSL